MGASPKTKAEYDKLIADKQAEVAQLQAELERHRAIKNKEGVNIARGAIANKKVEIANLKADKARLRK